MKKTVIILVLIINSWLSAETIFSKDSFYLKLNSFIGTDYFLEREYKSMNYFDRHHFYAGWKYNFIDNTEIWFDLTFDDKFYEKEILLNRVGVSYTKSDFTFSYKIDRLQYGENSKIYNIQVKDRFYNFGVMEDYRYNGIQIDYSKNVFSTNLLVAANDFNSVITNLSMNFKDESYFAKIFFLAVARNEEYNVRNYSLGFDSKFRFGNLGIYASGVYQKLPTYYKGDKFKQLVEFTYEINDNFSIGSNYFMEDFMDISNANKQSQSFVKIAFKKNEVTLFYRNNSMNEFTQNYKNEEYAILHQYRFANKLALGVNYSYFKPNFDQDYQQIGFQINYHYEKDL